MWTKGLREGGGLMNLGNVELLTQVNKQQPTKHQVTMKFTNTPNLKNTMNISHELSRK